MTPVVAHQNVQTGQGLAVSRLRMTWFRNYEAGHLDLTHAGDDPSRPVVLVGANGAGKTNVLEALSFLAPGRGLRGARLGEVAAVTGPGTWAVSAIVESGNGRTRIGTGVDSVAVGRSAVPEEPERQGDEDFSDSETRLKRLVRIDGAPAEHVNILADYVAVSWLTPQMDRLFLDSSAVRRRFLDRQVSSIHPDHNRQINAYEKLMRDRLRLLVEQGYRGADPVWLNVLEAKMAEHGVAIAAARLETVELMSAQFEALEDSPFPKALLSIDGTVEAALAAGPALAAEDSFRQALADSRAKDAQSGRTTHGTHRSDLMVHHAPKAMPAVQCSTGEQKALLVGLVLAQAAMRAHRTGVAPLILLDEIAAHLDQSRRAALFEIVTGLGSQAWLTGTDLSLFDALVTKADFFCVEDGNFRPIGSSVL